MVVLMCMEDLNTIFNYKTLIQNLETVSDALNEIYLISKIYLIEISVMPPQMGPFSQA